MEYGSVRTREGQQPNGANSQQVNATGGKKKTGKGLDLFKILLMIFVATATILALLVIVYMALNRPKSESNLIKNDQYQAVFLDDQSGQVYFGKLDLYNAKYYKLTDIYYVRVDNAVQPDKSGTAQQNISLAKLGNELHGPEDEMFIARDQVLFWENLKGDGQVVKAIEEYKKNGGTSTTPTTPATTPATGTSR